MSRYVVAGIIGGVAELYLEHHNSRSINLMIDSTTWVHKADLHNIGKISETDYGQFRPGSPRPARGRKRGVSESERKLRC